MACDHLASEYHTLTFILGLGFVMCALGQNLSLMCLSGACHCRNTVHELGLEENAGIGEHAVFQRHDHKLQKGKKGRSSSGQLIPE